MLGQRFGLEGFSGESLVALKATLEVGLTIS